MDWEDMKKNYAWDSCEFILPLKPDASLFTVSMTTIADEKMAEIRFCKWFFDICLLSKMAAKTPKKKESKERVASAATKGAEWVL